MHRPGSVQSQLRLTAPAVGRADPAYAALQLANLVFGGYFSSRWMENIREDKGYTYGAHSGVEFVPGGGVLGLETDVASDVTAAALLETRYELGRLVAVPPTAAEVDAARAYAIGSLAISLDSQGGLASSHQRDGRRRPHARLAPQLPRAAGRRHPGGGRGRGAAVLRALGGHRRGRRRRGRDRPGAAGVGRRGMTFRLTTPAVLSRSEVFRDETLRTDLARQEAGWATARLVVVDDEGRTPVEWTDAPSAGFEVGDAGSWDRGGSARLRTRPTEGATPTEGAVLLGEQDGVAYWAVRGKPDVFAGDDPTDWADLRMAGAVLDGMGAGLFVTAVAVLNWHDTARYCSRDGSPTRVAAAGWHRHCEAAGHEEYPRTDPAVICLVHDGGSGDTARVLLARQPVWPIGRFTRARRVRRGGGVARRRACGGRSTRRSASTCATSPTSAARPGRSRAR